MKKFLSCLLLTPFLITISSAFAESGLGAAVGTVVEEVETEKTKKAPKTFDVRNVNWGSTRAQVKAAEKAKLLDDSANDSLTYADAFAGHEAYLLYLFSEDKLASVSYLIQVNHTDPKDYLGDYDRMKEALVKLYGKPVGDEINWENEELKNQPDKIGEALGKGHIQKTALWIQPTTEVRLLLARLEGTISLQVIYTIKDLAEK